VVVIAISIKITTTIEDLNKNINKRIIIIKKIKTVNQK